MKYIGILGSTGSVGSQSLEVVWKHQDKLKIKFLAAKSNVNKLIEQCNKFSPDYVCIYDESKYELLKRNTDVKNILVGSSGIFELCQLTNIDTIINAIVGYQGLEPTIKIIESGTNIALSNKESIVQAGHIVIELAKSKNVEIFPIDSEHSALWQCILGEPQNRIRKIILTASGGPFRTLPYNKFSSITPEEALAHPNWSMGNKISIDSATMMNKGFEMIEAFWLFNIQPKNIEIVIHPQSIIHSMVEYVDGSIKAQLSNPDMRLPIQYALSYPDRFEMDDLKFDISKFSNLEFSQKELDKFECIDLAFKAINLGGSYPTILNVSNDLAVELFLNKKIKFLDIPKIIKDCMDSHNYIKLPLLSDILSLTKWTESYINRKYLS